jgi:hypothetical protein
MIAINSIAENIVGAGPKGRIDTVTYRYGCFNRRDHVASYPAPDGHWLDGQAFVIKAASIKTTAKRECQYTSSALGLTDPGCTNCNRKQKAPQ